MILIGLRNLLKFARACTIQQIKIIGKSKEGQNSYAMGLYSRTVYAPLHSTNAYRSRNDCNRIRSTHMGRTHREERCPQWATVRQAVRGLYVNHTNCDGSHRAGMRSYSETPLTHPTQFDLTEHLRLFGLLPPTVKRTTESLHTEEGFPYDGNE